VMTVIIKEIFWVFADPFLLKESEEKNASS
jgi:hypothetical protein